jgi:hypothetical protein
VYGKPIEHLGASGFYSSRKIQGLNGGTSACQIMQPPVCPSAASNQVTPVGPTTFAGNMATINFTVAAGCENVKLSFVSYKAPSNVYTAEEADQQVLFRYVTDTFQAGPGQMTVEVPNCYFQLDFVYGEHLDHLGPAGSTNFYSSRKIRGQMGGTAACVVEQPPTEQPTTPSDTTTPPVEQPVQQVEQPVQNEQPVTQQPVQEVQPVTQQPTAPVVQTTTPPTVITGVAGATKTIAKKPTVKKKVVKRVKAKAKKVKKVTKHAVAAKAVVRRAGFTG